MRKRMIVALAVAALCGAGIVFGGPGLSEVSAAGNGHGGGKKGGATQFTSATTGINSSGFLIVSFNDNIGSASAGMTENYTWTATGAATWVCATGGGGKGKNQAAGSQDTNYENTTNFSSDTVPNNGTVSAGAWIAPPAAPPAADCGAGTWQLGAVSYLISSGALANVTLGYNADDAMSGSCSIGNACSQVFISGITPPAP